jgi:hypothetical protein
LCRGAIAAVGAIEPLSRTTADEVQAGRVTSAVLADVARFTGQFIRVAGALPRKVEALPIPPGNQAIRQWLALERRTTSDLVAMHKAAATKNRAAFLRAANDNATATKVYIALSQRLGFRVCGQPGNPTGR